VTWFRTVLSALLSVAMLVAPMSAALARGTPRLNAHETQGPAQATVHDDAATSTHDVMHDCAGMKGAAGDSDCPHCAKDKACSPDVCLAKCFQMLGLVPQPVVDFKLAGLRFRPAELIRPPDRSWRPQPPPPRA